MYKILKIVAILMVIIFWVAGIFLAIDYQYYIVESHQYYPVNLWLTNTLALQYADLNFINLITTYNWPVWLNYAMYWALQTLSTLGYGDITPRNPVEVAYCDIVIIAFCLVYPFFLNSAWEIIVELLDSRDNVIKSKALKFIQKNYKIDN